MEAEEKNRVIPNGIPQKGKILQTVSLRIEQRTKSMIGDEIRISVSKNVCMSKCVCVCRN